MADSICKCFVGIISRLINSLNGFDPLVSINISDLKKIAQIIQIVKNKLIKTNTYTVDLHRKLVTDRLTKLEYPNDVIKLWVQNIE